MNWRRKYESSSTISKIESSTSIWPSSRLPLASSAVVSGGSRRDQDLFYRTFIMQNEHNEMATLMNFLYFSCFYFFPKLFIYRIFCLFWIASRPADLFLYMFELHLFLPFHASVVMLMRLIWQNMVWLQGWRLWETSFTTMTILKHLQNNCQVAWIGNGWKCLPPEI